jgi:Serine/threonine protein kinase
MLDIIVSDKYQIVQKIGFGSFGEIYKGLNLTNKQPVAIKIEKTNSRHPQLIYESKLIKILQGPPGIPEVY